MGGRVSHMGGRFQVPECWSVHKSRQELSEVKLGLTELVGIPVVSSMPVPDTDPCKTFKRN